VLVSDLIEVPHEALADWTALIAAAIVYLIFAIAVLLSVRAFIARTGMPLLGSLAGGLVMAAGLAGYFAIFVAVDSATYGHAVNSALGRNPAGEDHELTRLSRERARSILGIDPMDARRIAFYGLPLAAVVVAVAVARWRSKTLPRRD
jgi:hypothetical protein